MTDSVSPKLEEYVKCRVIGLLKQIDLHERKEGFTQYQRRWC